MTSVLDVCLRFADAHPADAARTLGALPPADVAALFEEDRRLAALALDAMIPTAAADCLAAMRISAAADAIVALRTDRAADLMRRLSGETAAALLDALPSGQAAPLRTLLRFAEGTAGALLDPRALALPEDVTVGEGTRRLRKSAGDMLYYLYVVDAGRRLTGVLDVRELLTAPHDVPLSAVMRTSVARLRASADREAILAHPGWRRVHALPVVDEDGVLLGAIRYQTLRRIEEERMERDGGSEPLATARALGELYWLGLTGMLEGLAASAVRTDAPRPAREPPPEGL